MVTLNFPVLISMIIKISNIARIKTQIYANAQGTKCRTSC